MHVIDFFVAGICHTIGAATHLYKISDLAQKSGLARPSIHRAFAGDPIKPNFTTVFNVSMRGASGCRLRCAWTKEQRARNRLRIARSLSSDANGNAAHHAQCSGLIVFGKRLDCVD